jgi:pimeloyl-ACP methyl ester carboxylesterase
MDLTVNGRRTYCYTGGRSLLPGRPTVVFLHGVLNAHCVWILQSRWFAHHGWNVLAPDLPGHLRSAGEAPRSVEEGADFVLALLDAAGVGPAGQGVHTAQAALVGHSFGSLIALETAARAPDRVSHLALVGTAYPMKVSPALLESSLHTPHQAIELVAQLSHALQAPPPSVLGPGTWVPGTLRALMRRVLASNPAAHLFHRGFKACDDYRGGEAAMARVTCPTLFLLGQRDAMTPPRAAGALQALAIQAQTQTLACGHNLMAEDPEGVLSALRGFLRV